MARSGCWSGGVLTQALSWHWIFFINVPIGVVTFVLGRSLIDENEGLGIRNGVDVAGSVLVTVALMLGIYAIIQATEYGWVSAHTLGFGGAAVVLLVGFFVLESRLANPIMPLRILRTRTLLNSSVVRGFLAAGAFTTFFLGALYFEHVLGYSPIRTGLAFLPISVMMGVLSVGDHRPAGGPVRQQAGPGAGDGRRHCRPPAADPGGPGHRLLHPGPPGLLARSGSGAGTAFMPLLVDRHGRRAERRRRARVRAWSTCRCRWPRPSGLAVLGHHRHRPLQIAGGQPASPCPLR